MRTKIFRSGPAGPRACAIASRGTLLGHWEARPLEFRLQRSSTAPTFHVRDRRQKLALLGESRYTDTGAGEKLAPNRMCAQSSHARGPAAPAPPPRLDRPPPAPIEPNRRARPLNHLAVSCHVATGRPAAHWHHRRASHVTVGGGTRSRSPPLLRRCHPSEGCGPRALTPTTKPGRPLTS